MHNNLMKHIISDSVTIDKIRYCHGIPADQLEAVSARYPFRVSRYYADLIRKAGDAIWKQCIPDPREIMENDGLSPDPLAEEALSPIPGLIHRYPDRVVLLVSNQCPTYCRFCMRKRQVGSSSVFLPDRTGIMRAIDYITNTPEIHDVILSGGDPLMLTNDELEFILARLYSVEHVHIIRIGTRVPVTLPDRVDEDLCKLLKNFQPLYITTHFNCPAEITPQSSRACSLLADSGIPLANQTVLLRGVNDDSEIMAELMEGLLKIRVRPYYIHQMDLVKGTAHFRTPVIKGLEIMQALRGHISGLAVPQYVIDLPGGKGKVPLLPDVCQREGDLLILKNYRGERIEYPDLPTAPQE